MLVFVVDGEHSERISTTIDVDSQEISNDESVATSVVNDKTDLLAVVDNIDNHMSSRQSYWCSKTKKRRPHCCTKPFLRELNSILKQKTSFVVANQYGHWSRV